MPRDGEPPEAWEGFAPLRRASKAKRVVLFVLGPLAWVVALGVLVVIVRDDAAVEIGLLIAVGSSLVAFVLLSVARLARVRREEGG